MAILYVTEQGASLVKRGERLVVEKMRKTIHWVHAFKIEQVVLMGAISVSPGAVAFLLERGVHVHLWQVPGPLPGMLPEISSSVA